MSWLLLHGALASADQYDTHLDVLPLAQAYTFPHHGERADGAPFTIDQLAFEIRPAVDEHMNILGHSMGGYVALWLAARYGQTFKQIICWGTKLDWNEHFYQSQIKFLQPGLFLEKRPQLAHSLESQHGKDWPLLVKQTLSMMQLLTQVDQLRPEDFAKITTPVTLMVGGGDRLVSLQEAQHFASLMPNARAIVCEDFGHDMPQGPQMQQLLTVYNLD